MSSQRSQVEGSAPTGSPHTAGRLRSNSIGVFHIVFFVVSAAAPLSAVVLGFPVVIGLGNGLGAPGAYIIATGILLLFAVGYTAMSRHIVNAGGFYTFVAQGLGRVAGLGASTLAIFSYTGLQAGMFGALGAYVNRLLEPIVGFSIPWYLYALIGVLAVLTLGVREIKVGARVLGVMLTLETLLVLLLDVAVVVTGGASGNGPLGLSFEPFSPAHVLSGSFGIAIVFAFAAYMGFEATTIYGEEAINPKRTVPRATYIAVTAMGIFYTLSIWLLINAYGIDAIIGVAQNDPETLAANAIQAQLGSVAFGLTNLMIVTSIFAAQLAMHNTISRYMYALGRQQILWPALGRTSRTHQAPYVACGVQAATAAAIITAFAIAGADPYTEVFVWATGIGSVGVIALQTLASVAIFAFFRRNNVDKRLWHTMIAPILGILGLGTMTAIAMDNFDLLVGSTSRLTIVAMSSLLVLAVLAGVCRALWLRNHAPESYNRIGSMADGIEVENTGF
ncbi:APC family permease [Mycobacterium sp. DSM 3803]|nr:APC family permease [Mycobacterium sp. DSM 3803]